MYKSLIETLMTGFVVQGHIYVHELALLPSGIYIKQRQMEENSQCFRV